MQSKLTGIPETLLIPLWAGSMRLNAMNPIIV